jgi:hypothetical protein
LRTSRYLEDQPTMPLPTRPASHGKFCSGNRYQTGARDGVDRFKHRAHPSLDRTETRRRGVRPTDLIHDRRPSTLLPMRGWRKNKTLKSSATVGRDIPNASISSTPRGA